MKKSASVFGSAVNRRAFTLVELLVVMSIIIVLAGLLLLFNPKSQKRLAAQGADQLQTYLASARSRALRDNVPSGVRLLADAGGNFREFQFVQSPDPFNPVDPSKVSPNQSKMTVNQGTGTANFANCFSLTGSVQKGDMLEIVSGSGSIHRIVSPDPQAAGSVNLASIPPSALTSNLSLLQGFRFIRQPQPLIGEGTLMMPKSVLVSPSASLNMPVNFNGQPEIIFAPSGQVINATAGHIVLWVTDDDGISSPTLLTIYSRTGGIAALPSGPPGSLYLYTQDGHGSGQ